MINLYLTFKETTKLLSRVAAVFPHLYKHLSLPVSWISRGGEWEVVSQV